MAVRHEIHATLGILKQIGDPEKVELFLETHPELTEVLDLEVHQSPDPNNQMGSRLGHEGKPQHGNFEQLARMEDANVPYRRG